jgi:hypothetical protein
MIAGRLLPLIHPSPTPNNVYDCNPQRPSIEVRRRATMAEYMAIEVGELIEKGLAVAASQPADAYPVVEIKNAALELSREAYHASALGFAFIGKEGTVRGALARWQRNPNTSPGRRFLSAAKFLGISPTLARLIELNHRNGVPAIEIARRLRTGTLGLAMNYHPAPAECANVSRANAERTFEAGSASHL